MTNSASEGGTWARSHPTGLHFLPVERNPTGIFALKRAEKT